MGINRAAGRIYCLEAGDKVRVVEFKREAIPLILTGDDQKADLFLLKPGDLIEVERGKDGRVQEIMVVARAWDG